ncbi:ABC transporter permease [Bacillus alkalicellulosilyticus]|uniref:ABC transporter permease n=1 Tax=Alkalihalobacterium alkalicellulosilyticum TaxID=1912214 RepID=UPI0009979B62|nr:ABC transporter permease [Bacillus alkalicellulosilyticus]
MSNFWIMLSHSYISKVKAKSFIITTLLFCVGIILLSNINTITSTFTGDGKDQVAVIDHTDSMFPILEEELGGITEDIELVLVTTPEAELETEVDEGIYEGALILRSDENGFPVAVYKSNTLAMNYITVSLTTALQHIQMSLAATNLDLTMDELASLHAPVAFTNEAITEGAKSEEELNQARGIVYVLLFFIYFAVIAYASMIATEVATEKSSRVMEILISSVSPVKQMFAKIIGISLVGLTQLTTLLLVGYFSVMRKQDELMGGFFEYFGFGEFSLGIIIYAIVFFLLGYFLYATIAALLGCIVSRIEDVNQAIMPLVFLVMIGFFIAMFGLGNPESAFITVTSYIPFFTPMVMFLRVGMLNISIIEPIVGMLVSLLSIIVIAYFGAKVYRGGVLMYGKSTSIKDFKKAIELTKK